MLQNIGRIVGIVQARTGSTRLPGKTIKEICGKPMLLLMLERLSKSKFLDDIVVATTDKKNDDVIYELVKSNGYNVFRGNEEDCLDRYYKAAKEFHANFICKMTSDCPLIDPEVIDSVIEFYVKNHKKYDYVSNVHPPTFPDGLDVEMFSFSALETAWKEATNSSHREHTTTFIWSQPHRFRIGNVENSNGENLFLSQRWTVDYPEDFQFVKAIYENLYKNGKIFLMHEILDFLNVRKDVWNLNAHLISKNAVH